MTTDVNPDVLITRNECQKCSNVERAFQTQHVCTNLYVVHSHRDIIRSGKKSPENLKSAKKKILQKIEKIVAALRNCEGGRLIIHLKGQENGDRYLEYFDEFINKRFGDFVEEGQLYVDAYTRHWLCELSNFKQYTDFVIVNIKKATRVITVDFNTKVNNDIENQNPSLVHITYLFNKSFGEVPGPQLKGIPDNLQNLQESRHVQLKSLKLKTDEEWLNITQNVHNFVEYVWSDLKLKDNITSISKVTEGGSYYVGICETPSLGTYKTKKPEITGFNLGVGTEELKRALIEKVNANVCVLSQGTFNEAPSDLIDIAFYVVQKRHPQHYVLEVAIRYYPGIVFSDKKGPRTYTIKDGETVRIDKTDWLDGLMKKNVATQTVN